MKTSRDGEKKGAPRKRAKSGAAAAAPRVDASGTASSGENLHDGDWLRQLARMGSLLRACQTFGEGLIVIREFGPLLFPGTGCALFVPDPEIRGVEAAASWGPELESEKVFTSDDCWALRRDRSHFAGPGRDTLACRHMKPGFTRDYLDVPVSVSGETAYLLHLETDAAADHPEIRERAEIIADRMAVALHALSLREALTARDIRDPVTGLFNRGYLEEALGVEIHRARRAKGALGVVTMDVDRLKRFNSIHGYEKGDALLREIGTLITGQVRKGDLCGRPGEDEFLVILPEAPLAVAIQRAERIREALQSLVIVTGKDRRPFETVTGSFGVAVYPDHGQEGEEILTAADKALSRALQEGGDRIVVAQASPQK